MNVRIPHYLASLSHCLNNSDVIHRGKAPSCEVVPEFKQQDKKILRLSDNAYSCVLDFNLN